MASTPAAGALRTLLEAMASEIASTGAPHTDSCEARALAQLYAQSRDRARALAMSPDIHVLRAAHAAAGLEALGIRATPQLSTSCEPAVDVEAACDVLAWRYRWPGCDASAIVISLHGGGRIAGTAAPAGTEGFVCEQLSRIANAAVLAFDYTLCPEATASQQVQQCLRVYSHVLKDVPARRVALIGGSGGGSLCLALLLAIQRNGLPLPAAACLCSPMATHDCDAMPSMRENMDIDVMGGAPAEFWKWLYAQIAGTGTPAAVPLDHPDVSPLCGEFKGLPPLYISASRCESFFSEAHAVAVRARDAGVDVTTSFSSGLFHCWYLAADFVPEGREELGCIGAWLRRNLHDERS